jgi:lipopolysaccharide transport system permease protein
MFSRHFWSLVTTKVSLNLKAEASKSYLSYLWWLLEPALFVAVLYIVFGIFLAKGTPNFVVFLMCGQIPFLWFARTVSNSCSAIEQGAGLMTQLQINKLFFPLVTILQDFIKSICVLALLVTFVLLYLQKPSIHWVALPAIVLTQLLFVASVSLFCAMLIPFLPDIRFLVSTGIQLMMFGSGIFYSYQEVILPEHQSIFLANPLANLITQYRNVLMLNQYPDWTALLIIAVVSGTVFFSLVWLLRRIDSVYPRLVIQ